MAGANSTKCRAKVLSQREAPSPRKRFGHGHCGRRIETPAPSRLVTLRISGSVPSEVWNRIGTKVLPKPKASGELTVGVDFSVRLTADAARRLSDEIAQALGELGLLDKVRQELS